MDDQYQVLELKSDFTLEQLKEMCPDLQTYQEEAFEFTVAEQPDGNSEHEEIGQSQEIINFSPSQGQCGTIIGQYEEQGYVMPVTPKDDVDHTEDVCVIRTVNTTSADNMQESQCHVQQVVPANIPVGTFYYASSSNSSQCGIGNQSSDNITFITENITSPSICGEQEVETCESEDGGLTFLDTVEQRNAPKHYVIENRDGTEHSEEVQVMTAVVRQDQTYPRTSGSYVSASSTQLMSGTSVSYPNGKRLSLQECRQRLSQQINSDKRKSVQSEITLVPRQVHHSSPMVQQQHHVVQHSHSQQPVQRSPQTVHPQKSVQQQQACANIQTQVAQNNQDMYRFVQRTYGSCTQRKKNPTTITTARRKTAQTQSQVSGQRFQEQNYVITPGSVSACTMQNIPNEGIQVLNMQQQQQGVLVRNNTSQETVKVTQRRHDNEMGLQRSEGVYTKNVSIHDYDKVVMILPDGKKEMIELDILKQAAANSTVSFQSSAAVTNSSLTNNLSVGTVTQHNTVANNVNSVRGVGARGVQGTSPPRTIVKTMTPSGTVVMKQASSAVMLKQQQATTSTTIPVRAENVVTVKRQDVTGSQNEVTGLNADKSSDVILRQIKNTGTQIVQSKQAVEEPPKFVPGKLALCQACGYTSADFNRCQRCKRKLPEDPKVVPESDLLKNKTKEELSIEAQQKICRSPRLVDGTTSDIKKAVATTNTSAAAKVTKTVKRARNKAYEEPVCLTISSDEEDSCKDESNDSMAKNDPGFETLPGDSSNKEPKITDNYDEASSDMYEHLKAQGVKGGGRELDIEGLMDGSAQGTYTLIQCRTVRIGSYKVVPRDRVLLSSKGVRICVPAIEDEDKNIEVTLNSTDIIKVLIHFGKGMPVLFLYTTPTAGASVRDTLGMKHREGPYYDPCSSDETQKRITLLPEKLSEDSKLILKQIYGPPQDLLGELDSKEANEILVRASPKEVQQIVKRAGMQGSQFLGQPEEVQTIAVYPPPPAKGGIAINTEDYMCLGEDQFLNDVIIDFYLKYLTMTKLSEDDRQRTHVFSSFFYKRLTTKPVKGRRPHPIEDNPDISAAEKRHSRVKGWTKSVHLFEKDFIVIPINEHAHWFLAIICFPGLQGCLRFSDDSPFTPPISNKAKRPGKKKKDAANESGVGAVTNSIQIGSTTITPVQSTTNLITLDDKLDDYSDRDEAEGDEEEMETSSDEEEEEPPAEEKLIKKQPEKVQKDIGKREPIKQPCILIFDSLAGTSRSKVVATLRDYLKIEYKTKMGKDREFNKDTIRGAIPKVPQQNNFVDCGVYVLQYVESFFENPIKDYTLPIKTITSWFPEEVVQGKREAIGNLIIKLMKEQNLIPNCKLPVIFSSPTSSSLSGASVSTTAGVSNNATASNTTANANVSTASTSSSKTVISANEIVASKKSGSVAVHSSENMISGSLKSLQEEYESDEELFDEEAMMEHSDMEVSYSEDQSGVVVSERDQIMGNSNACAVLQTGSGEFLISENVHIEDAATMKRMLDESLSASLKKKPRCEQKPRIKR